MDSSIAADEELPEPDALDLRLPAEIPGLRAFLRRLAGARLPAADLDDAVQETLVRALRSRQQYDAARPLGPWLRAAAVRAFLDLRERSARGARPPGESGREPEAPDRSYAEQRETVEALLASLSEVERTALLAFHRDGMSVQAIASRLGLPDGTVKSHLHRAREKLARRREDSA